MVRKKTMRQCVQSIIYFLFVLFEKELMSTEISIKVRFSGKMSTLSRIKGRYELYFFVNYCAMLHCSLKAMLRELAPVWKVAAIRNTCLTLFQPLFHSMRNNKTNRHTFAHLCRRLAFATSNYFEFDGFIVVCALCDWLEK